MQIWSGLLIRRRITRRNHVKNLCELPTPHRRRHHLEIQPPYCNHNRSQVTATIEELLPEHRNLSSDTGQ